MKKILQFFILNLLMNSNTIKAAKNINCIKNNHEYIIKIQNQTFKILKEDIDNYKSIIYNILKNKSHEEKIKDLKEVLDFPNNISKTPQLSEFTYNFAFKEIIEENATPIPDWKFSDNN